MAIQPIRPPTPHRGPFGIGIAPAKPKTPKLPKRDTLGTVRGTTIPQAPATTAVDDAMSAYRTALAQLNPAPIDATAIRAPYQQAEQATQQLGAGYGQMVQQAGDAASQQYTQGLNEAQKAAAAFGISAGAGANPTALQNTGAAPIALQTQANTAAAVGAAPQWQHLLESAAAGKIADATTQRQAGLDSAQASLASSIPGLIGSAQDRRFQAKTEKFNEGLALSQLTAKQAADLRAYNLDVTKANNSTATASANTKVSQLRLDETKRHDLATEKGAATRGKQAAAKGAKGIPQVLSALKISTTKGSATQKAAKGFDVQVQPWDTANNKPNGPAVTKHLPRLDVTLPGYKVLTGTATTHWETVPSKGSKSGGMSLAQWNKAVGIYATYNGVSRAEAAKAVQAITPRPPK